MRLQRRGSPEKAMTAPIEISMPLPGAAFGATVRLSRLLGETMPEGLPQALADAGGLLLIPGLGEITQRPRLLVDLSYKFGPEVEDYRRLLTRMILAHEDVPEIFQVTNMVPNFRRPPDPPVPLLTSESKFPVQYPQREGWHTDQSYRRPPPDISLFYAVLPVPRDRGQTLFADGTRAYEALPSALKKRVDGLVGIHMQPGRGRSRDAVLRGDTPRPLQPHERPQLQPVVRTHPVTGKKALYLCESGQMDWIEGPFVGMQPGPHGDGAALLD